MDQPHGERGATAVLITASLLVLFAFAAVAIDVGAAKSERRLDQNTVDAAALAAGVELIVGGNEQDAVDTVKSYVNTNLGRPVSDADWTACSDPGALSSPSDTLPSVTNGSNCISFGPNSDGVAFASLRVKLPSQATDTTFGQILSTAFLSTSADATVSIDGTTTFGSFPASVFSPAAAGDSLCVKDGTGTAGSETCENNTTGDFGNFQPYFYSDVNPSQNPNTTCTSGNSPAALAYTMAEGIDHFLDSGPPAGTATNGANCPGSPGPLNPDRVDSGSGYSNSDITDGIVAGGTFDNVPFTGRLTKSIWPTYGAASIFGNAIDNRPLWSYIDTSNAALPASCVAAAGGPDFADPFPYTAYTTAEANMLACLTANPANLFTAELYDSARLTTVPKFHQNAPLGNNSCCYTIQDFVPIFLNSIWTDNGPQWTCSGTMINDPANDFCRHDPGRTGSISIAAAGQQRINSMSGLVLSCEMLAGPEPGAEKCKKIGPPGNQTTKFQNIFLTD